MTEIEVVDYVESQKAAGSLPAAAVHVDDADFSEDEPDLWIREAVDGDQTTLIRLDYSDAQRLQEAIETALDKLADEQGVAE